MALASDLQQQIEQMAKLPKAARLGIVAAIVGALLFGYYSMFYRNASIRLQALNQNELELERRLTEVRSVASNIAAFEAEIKELETELKRALRKLPNKQEIEVLLTDISSLGKQSGIEITSFRRLPEISHSFYAEVPIQIELEGGYHDVATFFDRLSKLPRIVNMGSINIEILSENADFTRLRVSGMATTFRFQGGGGDTAALDTHKGGRTVGGGLV